MSLPRLTLDARELADLELIATGAAHPLTGFATEREYHGILAGAGPWPVPFVVALTHAEKDAVAAAGAAMLEDDDGRPRGVLRATSLYLRDPIVEARALYDSDDVNHPGVAYAVSRPRWTAGGPIELRPLPGDRAPLLTAAATRAAIAACGWRTVAGYETRGVLLRPDERAIERLLDTADGVVVLVLPGELPVDVRVRAIDAVVPRERVLVAALFAPTRHAGPREAQLHSLLRKNYGITSSILELAEAGPSHPLTEARIRRTLRAGGRLPHELIRAEVAAVLRDHYLADVQAAIPGDAPVVTEAVPCERVLERAVSVQAAVGRSTSVAAASGGDR